MTKRCSRKEWLKKRDEVNAQLRADIRNEKRRANAATAPAPVVAAQTVVPEPDEDESDRDRPYYLRND
jgi:hypothetical protein